MSFWAACAEAVDHFSDYIGRLSWKTLYPRERLCDWLFYGPVDGERAARRSRLLQDQEVYGSCTRNVPWTLTNVADDFLQKGEPDKAESYFCEALQ